MRGDLEAAKIARQVADENLEKLHQQNKALEHENLRLKAKNVKLK